MTLFKKIAAYTATAALIGTGTYYAVTSNSIQHTAHWKVVPSGGYWNYPCVAGDTLVLDGTYTYLSFGNVSGKKDSTIVILGQNNPVMSNGFNFQDCNYWHITGNILIKNAAGTAISISGKSNHFEVNGVTVDSAYYFVWFKTEPADHACDSSYWHSMNMDDFYLHDCVFKRAKQDGIYIGSTDQNADRAVTCNGKTYFPLPATVSNIKVKRITITGTPRTGIQISGCTSGNNFIRRCNISNCGNEFNPYQGAGAALGGYDKNVDIAYDTIKNTYLNNLYSYGGSTISIHDNVFDSADICYGIKNPQVNASILLSATMPTTFQLRDNKIGYNNSNTSVVIYGISTYISDSSYTCNTGLITNNTGKQISVNCK